MNQIPVPTKSLQYLESHRLFVPGPPIPSGAPGSLLAARLYDLGWTPNYPLFPFIHDQGVLAQVSELYLYAESSSLGHHYIILRVDIHDYTSWLRIDWTGVLTWETLYGVSEHQGHIVTNISLDRDTLVTPSDRLFIHDTTISVSLPTISDMAIELSKIPYHIYRWNCIHFALNLRERIAEATFSSNW